MPQPSKILVWDLPTRTFHWLLVLSFSVAWITHEDNRYLYAHTVAGYFFFGLLLFRIAWGVIGSHYARFRAFAYDWRSASGYLRALLSGQASRYLGHNPIGSWAIFLLLALGLLISISGLVVLGGEEGHGVLRGIVPYALGKAAKEVHEALAATMVLVIIIHIAGVIVESLIHRENLVQAMLTGYKIGKETGVAISRFRLLGISLLIIFSVAGLYAFKGYLTARPGAPFLPFVGPSLADDPVWRKACAECHLAFHPSLLPARSWQKMLDEQAKHFGEDLGLDVADTEHLHAFLTA
ncbi:MAG: cytochrome b/b6 domain-containing protein, partial [Gammaproteobacteria bacterium]|nr:cytochrome b/b6 domain-containing protein [Gammaproteobacteria bacterium]